MGLYGSIITPALDLEAGVGPGSLVRKQENQNLCQHRTNTAIK